MPHRFSFGSTFCLLCFRRPRIPSGSPEPHFTSAPALTPDQRERTKANAGVFFEEVAAPPYSPDEAALAAVAVPVQVMVSDQSHAFFAEAAGWLAARLGVEVVRTPGSHTPQRDHPDELVVNIRSFLREP